MIDGLSIDVPGPGYGGPTTETRSVVRCEITENVLRSWRIRLQSVRGQKAYPELGDGGTDALQVYDYVSEWAMS